MNTKMMVAAALAVPLALGSIAAGHGPDVVVVTGDTAAGENDPGGWLFNRDPNNATPIEFTNDEESIGSGSLYVEPISSEPARKFIGEHFLLTDMSDVESVSYDFLVGPGGNEATDANEFYLNVYANFDGGTQFGDCVYSVVPATASGWTTVVFDPDDSYAVRSRTSTLCPASPSDMGPDANIRMFALNLGDTSATDAGLDGYFDNVVVETTSGTTVYDFEAAPDSKADCKKGGWADFGFRNQGQCIKMFNTGKDSR